MIFFTIPNLLKYKKKHKIKLNSQLCFKNHLIYGEYGIFALENGYLSLKQIEAIRKIIMKKIKKLGILYIRVFPNFSLTAKPAETRMGKGKGNPIMWVTNIKPGKILFEIKVQNKNILTLAVIEQLFVIIANKLSIKIKLIYKNN